jgi:hypothetical protein
MSSHSTPDIPIPSPRPLQPPAVPEAGPPRPLSDLLKAPAQVGTSIAAQRNLAGHGLQYLAATLVSYAGFGLATGLFGGWPTAWMAMAKMPAIALGSFLLCLPSLYVFSCLGGSPLSGSQIAVLGLACLAMVGFLLTALAPVVWLFAVSTSSLPFVVVLDLLVWFVGLTFALRFIARMKQAALLRQTGGVRVWFLVLALTSLQMATFLRPILTPPGASWWTPGKQFFLAHFASSFDGKPGRK